MQRLKLVLYLAQKCHGCEFIQTKMGNTISKLLESAPSINFTEIICDNGVEPVSLQRAFHSEVDGVLILSCRPDDCLDMMLDRRTAGNKLVLADLLAGEDIEKSPDLAEAGGVKWTSSN